MMIHAYNLYWIGVPALALMACVSAPQNSALESGRSLVDANCSSCHSVGVVGESPAPEAPPFRQLSEHYRVARLEEALTKGISIGHPAMPEFKLTAGDVDSVVVYLQSIQAKSKGESASEAPPPSSATPGEIQAGKLIVEQQCISCHAVRNDDESHNPKVPALRTLSERYSVNGLEAAFALGIMTGHPGMPEFHFGPEQIKAILAYLETIQTRRGA